MEIGVKPPIRYVKMKLGYKRSLPLTRRKAAFRALGVLVRAQSQDLPIARVTLLLYKRSREGDLPEGSDFSQQALWAASRWVG